MDVVSRISNVVVGEDDALARCEGNAGVYAVDLAVQISVLRVHADVLRDAGPCRSLHLEDGGRRAVDYENLAAGRGKQVEITLEARNLGGVRTYAPDRQQVSAARR